MPPRDLPYDEKGVTCVKKTLLLVWILLLLLARLLFPPGREQRRQALGFLWPDRTAVESFSSRSASFLP